MKKCLYDACPNEEGTPGVEFHEVFEDTDNNGLPVSKLDCWICSVHLLRLEKGQDMEISYKTSKIDNRKKQTQPETTKKQPEAHKSLLTTRKQPTILKRPPAPATNKNSQPESKTGQPRVPESSVIGQQKTKSSQPIECCGVACGLTLKEHPAVPFFTFPPPADPRYTMWVHFAGLSGSASLESSHWLCGRHFDQSQYADKTLYLLKDDAVPLYKAGVYNPKTKNYQPSHSVGNLVKEEKHSPREEVSQTLNPQIKTHQYLVLVERPKKEKLTASEEVSQALNPKTKKYQQSELLECLIKEKLNPSAELNTETKGDHHLSDRVELSIKGMLSPSVEYMSLAECDAINCPSAYRNNNSIKFFRIPMHSKTRSEEWIKAVGGLKKGSKKWLICEYHFPEKTFRGPASLLPRSCPAFPYGPLNPRTKDYCPVGQEHLSVLIRQVPAPLCCVPKCATQTLSKLALFYFPSHDKEAFDMWVQRTGINTACFPCDYISKSLVVCPKHFSAHCRMTEKDKNCFTLRFGALPSLFLPAITCVIDETKMDADGSRSQVSPEKQLSGGSGRFIDTVQESQPKLPSCLRTVVKYYSPDYFKNEEEKTSRVTLTTEEIKNYFPRKRPQTWEKADNNSSKQSELSSNAASVFESLVNSLGLPKQVGVGRVRKRRPNRREEPQKRKKRGKVESSTDRVPEPALDVGNEVDIGTTEEDPFGADSNIKIHSYCSVDALKTPDELPIEAALLKIYNSTHAPDKNAFSVLSDPSSMPEPENRDISEHEYSSNSTVSVIKSAASLCQFNDMKIKQLERLIGASVDATSELESVLAQNLNAVLCHSSVEFLKKCFDQVIQLGIEMKKKTDAKDKKMELNPPEAPEGMKKMAAALQAHSGKAYCALSQVLDLPPPSRTREWATHRHGYPGYSEESFRLIRDDQKKVGGKKNVIYCLSVLEVPLKKRVEWDGDRIFGHVDLGFGRIENESVQEATRALVFYGTSLSDFRKLPLGYCLFDDMSVQVRANLITQFIVKLDNVNAKCIAVVADSSVTSYQVFIELGAISDLEHTPNMGSFVHPVNRQARVHCFVDAAQMLESVDALWLEKRVLSNKDGKRIDWSVLEKMKATLKCQAEDLFKKHSEPMSSAFIAMFKDLVAMMARIPEGSPLYHKYCAVALSVFRNALHLRDFAESSDTIKFLVNLSFVHDSFSSCHPFGEGDRKPLGANKTWWSEASRLIAVFNYFTGLSLENGVRIVLSERKMLITLICMDVASLRNLTRKVTTENSKFKLPVIYTESLTLNNVRQMIHDLVGSDRTCTPLEFKNAYRGYLSKLTLTPSDVLIPASKPQSPSEEDTGLGFSMTFAYSYKPISSVSDTVPQFLAGNAIESWLTSCKCIECSQLVQNEVTKYCNGDRVGNLMYDILALFQRAERVFSEYDDIPCHDFNSFFLQVSYQTMNSLTSIAGFLNHGHLFNSVRFGEVAHFTVMAKGMLRAFLKVRLCFLPQQERIKIQEPRNWALTFRLGRSWT